MKRSASSLRQPGIAESFAGPSHKRRAFAPGTVKDSRALCTRCKDLRLAKVIDQVEAGKHQPTTHEGILVGELGRRSRWSKDSCPLCEFLLQVTSAEDSQKGFGWDRWVVRLVTRRLMNAYDSEHGAMINIKSEGVVIGTNERQGGWGGGQIPELDEPLLAVVSDQRDDMCASGDYGAGVGTTGFISWIRKGKTTAADGRGKILDKQQADFDMLNEWLDYCCMHHTDTCMLERSVDMVQNFRLIDCTSNTVVHATPDMEYLALSYVWGASTDEALLNGKLLWEKLPQTIRDALDIAKKLRGRYLWIDRYCIPYDSTVKHLQISQMDIIYQRARATILVSSDGGATHGIPGAGTALRQRQPQVMVGSYKLFSTLPSPDHSIQKSLWMTRGWTYQEGMLSRRRICFTERQCYYECKGMQCAEALPPNLNQWHRQDKKAFLNTMNRETFKLSARNLANLDIWAYISAYSYRKLSFDSDSLNGFLGILSYLESAIPSLRHWWGIPISSNRDRLTRGSKLYPKHCFLTGLIWYHTHKSKTRRRASLPSWSWTGWEGAMYSNGLAHSYWGCECDEENTADILGAQTEDGQFLDWNTLQTLLSTKSNRASVQPRIIVLAAWTVQLRVKHFQFKTDFIHEPGYHAHAHVEQVQLVHATLRDCFISSRVLSFDRGRPGLVERIEHEPFTGVLLGCSKEHQERQILLLDRRPDGVYERIGVVGLRQSSRFYGRLVDDRDEYRRLRKRFTGTFVGHASEMETSCGPDDVGRRVIIEPLDAIEVEQWGLEKTWQKICIA